MRMMLLHQFTFTSAPHIWSGDELGMWGADDPDCRKPLLWNDVEHRPQVFTPDGQRHVPIPVKPDREMFNFHRELIALRKKRPDWSRGKLQYLLANDAKMTLAYRRDHENNRSIVSFNFSDTPQSIRLKVGLINGAGVLISSRANVVKNLRAEDSELEFELAPVSGAALWLD